MEKELSFITDLLAEFLGTKDPEHVAQVLSRLDKTLPCILRKLPGEMQAEAILHLLQLRGTSHGMLKWTVTDLGGPAVVAEILNRSGSKLERDVLVYLDEHDPELGQEIRSEMFSFADIARLPNPVLKDLLQRIDTGDVVVALKGAEEQLVDRFIAATTPDKQEQIKKDLGSIGPVPITDVKQARERFIAQVRQMERQGEVSIVRGEGGIRDTVL